MRLPRRRGPCAAGAAHLVLMGVLMSVPAMAWAQAADGITTGLKEVDAAAELLAREARETESRVAPGTSEIPPSEALNRFQDAVYLYLIGDHGRAAERFFALTASGALVSLGLDGEARWYLAESLFEFGSTEIAEGTYLAIVREPGNPFRDDAVRRLLEIYARDENPARFDRLFEAEILRGGVTPSDAVVYAVGKAFWVKRNAAEARGWFSRIGPESPYNLRARYFLGAMRVAEGTQEALAEATGHFRAVVDAPVPDPGTGDARLRDLAWLALARIAFEVGDFRVAVGHYGEVGGESDFLDDKLHELVWTFIKQGDYTQAISAIEIFLLAFPDHRYAPELQLVQGHLLFEEERLGEAMVAYDRVAADYAPVRDRFDRLARKPLEARDEFEALLDVNPADLFGVEDEIGLPAYAVAMMFADPDFDRAVRVEREIRFQETAILDARELAAELEPALGSGMSPARFARARLRALEALVETLELRVRLLDLSHEWLRQRGAARTADRLAALAGQREDLARGVAAARARLDRAIPDLEISLGAMGAAASRADMLREDLAKVEKEVEGASARGDVLAADAARAELERLQSALVAADAVPARVAADVDALAGAERAAFLELTLKSSSLWTDHQRLRATAGVDPSLDATGARLDAVHLLLDQASARFRNITEQLTDGAGSRLGEYRAVYAESVADLDASAAILDGAAEGATDAGGMVVQENFRRLRDLFGDSVLGADIGIVNIRWSEWVATGEERDRLAAERNDLVAEIEKRFAALQIKLAQ